MDWESADHYEVLQVHHAASAAVIRASYRALVQQYHPDRFQPVDEAERITKRLNEAYAVLGDDELRTEYDRHRSTAGQERQGAPVDEPPQAAGEPLQPDQPSGKGEQQPSRPRWARVLYLLWFAVLVRLMVVSSEPSQVDGPESLGLHLGYGIALLGLMGIPYLVLRLRAGSAAGVSTMALMTAGTVIALLLSVGGLAGRRDEIAAGPRPSPPEQAAPPQKAVQPVEAPSLWDMPFQQLSQADWRELNAWYSQAYPDAAADPEYTQLLDQQLDAVAVANPGWTVRNVVSAAIERANAAHKAMGLERAEVAARARQSGGRPMSGVASRSAYSEAGYEAHTAHTHAQRGASPPRGGDSNIQAFEEAYQRRSGTPELPSWTEMREGRVETSPHVQSLSEAE